MEQVRPGGEYRVDRESCFLGALAVFSRHGPTRYTAPPLPDDMDPAEWGREFADAFAELGKDVDDGRRTRIDPYGATNPAEFFAVLSETFFEKPQAVREEMPAVHELLVRYYRQDPMD